MKLLHTSDWHLGHVLHQMDRAYEHGRFVEWLLAQIEAQEVDWLLITGDIFDHANPSAAAQTQWYRFLARAAKHLLGAVVIGGNHDAAMRLNAPRALLAEMDIHIVGGLPRDGSGQPDYDQMLIPLRNRAGKTVVLCAAMPFLRVSDLPTKTQLGLSDDQDPFIYGVRHHYDALLQLARDKKPQDALLLATGHCYMTGSALSELSERKILGGNQHALPLSIFPQDVDLVALGHLHKAQCLGSPHRRYAGSPLPLSLSERDYKHQVVLWDLSAGLPPEPQIIEVPRAVDLMRIPESEALPLEGVLPLLQKLPQLNPQEAPEHRPLLEVQILLDKPQHGLRHKIEAALEKKRPRLVKITPVYRQPGEVLAQAHGGRQLQQLDASEVFIKCYQRAYGNEPDASYLDMFSMLVEEVGQT